MYSRYLLKKLLLYLAAGTAFSVLLGLNVAVIRYIGGVEEVMYKTEGSWIKTFQTRRYTQEMNNRIRQINALVPERAGGPSDVQLLLRGFDDMESTFKTDKLTVTDLRRGGSEVSLPVEIAFDFDGYYRLLKRFDYLEGLTFPFFRFSSFAFSKNPSNTAKCAISGDLVMPVTGERPR